MNRSLALLIPLAGPLCLQSAAQAALSFSITTLTDTATAIPGGSGAFTAFSDPAQSLSVTVFAGTDTRP